MYLIFEEKEDKLDISKILKGSKKKYKRDDYSFVTDLTSPKKTKTCKTIYNNYIFI